MQLLFYSVGHSQVNFRSKMLPAAVKLLASVIILFPFVSSEIALNPTDTSVNPVYDIRDGRCKQILVFNLLGITLFSLTLEFDQGQFSVCLKRSSTTIVLAGHWVVILALASLIRNALLSVVTSQAPAEGDMDCVASVSQLISKNVICRSLIICFHF